MEFYNGSLSNRKLKIIITFDETGYRGLLFKNNISIVRTFKTDNDYQNVLCDVDGIICLGKFSKQEIKLLHSLNNKIVFLDMTVENIEITSVSLDFRQAVSDAIKYLYDLGHRTVGFIGGIEQLEDGTIFPDKRLNTFTDICDELNIKYDGFIMQDKFSTSSGYKMMSEMISKGNLPTAILRQAILLQSVQ